MYSVQTQNTIEKSKAEREMEVGGWEQIREDRRTKGYCNPVCNKSVKLGDLIPFVLLNLKEGEEICKKLT